MRPSSTPWTRSTSSSAHDQLRQAVRKARAKLVIVEGKKDAYALQRLGFARIVMLKNRPLYQVIEEITEKEVVILTDLDREGKRLYAILCKGLQRQGVRIDNRLRELLFQTKLRQIEGILSVA